MPINFSIGVGAKSTSAATRAATDFADLVNKIFTGDFWANGRSSDLPPAPPGDHGSPEFKAAKEGLPWIAPPFRDGQRKGANALPWPILALDVDRCSPDLVRPVVDWFRELAPTAGFTTASHADDAPRFRLLLELSRPTTAGERKALLHALVERMKAENPEWAASVGIDPSLQNAGQIAFLPCEGFRRIMLDNADAPPLDVDALLATVATENVATSPTLPPTAPAAGDWAAGRADTPEARSEFESAINAIDPDLPRDQWLDVLMACKAHGWDEAYARATVEAWSARGAKYDTAEFDKAWRSLKPTGGITPATLYYFARQAGGQQDECPDATTDDGLACRFVHWLDGKALHSRGQWHVWTGSYWQPDDTEMKKRLKQFAAWHDKETRKQHGPTAALGRDNPAGKAAIAIIAAAKKLLDQRKQNDVLCATSVMLAVDAERLDAQHDLLCVPNGAIDLRTGGLLPADPKHFMTMRGGCEYTPDAAAPRFEQFLREVFPDAEVRAYVQRWVGYCLTGHVCEEVMGAWHGVGANGKSVLSNLLDAVMGTYAIAGDPALLVSKSATIGQASPDFARMAGKRLCYINESNISDRLNSGTVKRLVSTEKITARAMYRDLFDFQPTAKILLRTNHRPTINDSGDGLWRRLHLVPFDQVFKGAARDDKLETKLRAELPGILAWAVRGAVEWYRQGLNPPQAVRAATQAYRADSDTVAEWLAQRVEQGGFTLTRALLEDYARHAGLKHPPTVMAFSGMLKDRQLEPKHTSVGNGFMVTLRQSTADEFEHVAASAVPPTRLATPPSAVDLFAGTEHAGKTAAEVCAEFC
jgi:putative DNA primase/helicase